MSTVSFPFPTKVAVDSGSPLICERPSGSASKTRFHLEGIVTFGTNCAQESRYNKENPTTLACPYLYLLDPFFIRPTLFTSVATHGRWIREKLRGAGGGGGGGGAKRK